MCTRMLAQHLHIHTHTTQYTHALQTSKEIDKMTGDYEKKIFGTRWHTNKYQIINKKLWSQKQFTFLWCDARHRWYINIGLNVFRIVEFPRCCFETISVFIHIFLSCTNSTFFSHSGSFSLALSLFHSFFACLCVCALWKSRILKMHYKIDKHLARASATTATAEKIINWMMCAADVCECFKMHQYL